MWQKEFLQALPKHYKKLRYKILKILYRIIFTEIPFNLSRFCVAILYFRNNNAVAKLKNERYNIYLIVSPYTRYS